MDSTKQRSRAQRPFIYYCVGHWARRPLNQWDVIIRSNSIVTSGGVVGNITANLPAGYARTGGGAASEDSGRGRLLTASHPQDSLSWPVSDKDHENAQAGKLTAYVIGIKPRLGVTPRVQVHTGVGATASHPTGRASIDAGFILTGGGARTSCNLGNLLTGSYPIDSSTWMAEAKDHDVSCPSIIDVWAMGIQQPPGSISVEGGGSSFNTVTSFSGNWMIAPGALPANRPKTMATISPKSTYYISQHGDTFLNLALRFYGNADWQKLRDANPSAAKAAIGSTIAPNTKILLPDLK